MIRLKLLIKNLNQSDFADFGEVLEFSLSESGFEVKISEESSNGWRIALLKKENKSIRAMQCHPESRESFEPLQGVAVLVVARHDSPTELEAFLLDKPICLEKGIWHNIFVLSEFAMFKITENAKVSSQTYELDCELGVVIA